MSTRRCAICGKELELRFGDTVWTRDCPACDLQQPETAQAVQGPLLQTADAAPTTLFPVTIGLIALNALVFAIMVLRGVSAFVPTPQQAIAFGADFGPLTP